MPQSYKGYEIPAYTDDADAVKAFQDYTASVDENIGSKIDTKVTNAGGIEKIVSISQQAYDNLTKPDPQTLYVVTEAS